MIGIIDLVGLLSGISNTNSISAQDRPLGNDRHGSIESGNVMIFIDFDLNSLS